MSASPDNQNNQNQTNSGWQSTLAAPFQFIAGFAISLFLIAGVGYASTWMTEGRCAICGTGSDMEIQAQDHDSDSDTDEATPEPEPAPVPEAENVENSPEDAGEIVDQAPESPEVSHADKEKSE